MSFLGDIFPFFDRLSDLQSVNQGVLDRYSWESPEAFLAPEYVARLADPSPANAAFRQALFERFRNPDYATLEAGGLLPPLYGDAVTFPPDGPRNWLAVPPCSMRSSRAGRRGTSWPVSPGPSRRSSRSCRS